MTYSTLQADVADYLHRADLTAKLPAFVALAEAYLFRELQIKDMALSVAGTTTGEYGTLPADFGSVSKVTITVGSAEYTLDYKSQDYSPSGVTYPTSYALENNEIRLFGASTGSAYTLYYLPKIAALSGVNTTNWLLENGYDAYLYATALEGAKYIRDAAQVQELSSIVPGLVDSVRRLSERKGQPTNASLQIKVRR
jgi:hypothetical protein